MRNWNTVLSVSTEAPKCHKQRKSYVTSSAEVSINSNDRGTSICNVIRCLLWTQSGNYTTNARLELHSVKSSDTDIGTIQPQYDCDTITIFVRTVEPRGSRTCYQSVPSFSTLTFRNVRKTKNYANWIGNSNRKSPACWKLSSKWIIVFTSWFTICAKFHVFPVIFHDCPWPTLFSMNF